MRRLLFALAALGLLLYLCTPPPAIDLPPAPQLADPVRGVVHVHTTRSDGGGTPERIARAARAAGHRFVVLTDHGDGTRAPDPPAYVDGVLVIDAVEISTDHGHVLALDLPGAAPYPLAGEARDVVEDVARMGGFAIAAHPGSPKPDLRWTDWGVPVHGLEHLNGDSEWRDESAWVLARSLIAYPVRPAETLGALFDRSDDILRRWDELTRVRPVVALAGADAHGRIGLRAEEPYAGQLALPIPGYEAVFRSASIALPGVHFSSNADRDARAVLNAIRGGRVFSTADALARQPRFEFSAESGGTRAVGGDVLALGAQVRIDVAAQAPPDAEIVLLRDGVRRAASRGGSLHHDAPPEAGVYRAEVHLPRAPGSPPVPWIVSNPIYIGRPAPAPPPERTPMRAAATASLYADGPASAWTIEHSGGSEGAVDAVSAVTGMQLLMRFALSGARSAHPYAAFVVASGPDIASYDRLAFTARADAPMRVSVQLRAPGADSAGERWHRSVFVDTVPRDIVVRFDDLRPRGATSTATAALDRVRWVLFVVDTVNTPVGASGQLIVDDVRYER